MRTLLYTIIAIICCWISITPLHIIGIILACFIIKGMIWMCKGISESYGRYKLSI